MLSVITVLSWESQNMIESLQKTEPNNALLHKRSTMRIIHKLTTSALVEITVSVHCTPIWFSACNLAVDQIPGKRSWWSSENISISHDPQVEIHPKSFVSHFTMAAKMLFPDLLGNLYETSPITAAAAAADRKQSINEVIKESSLERIPLDNAYETCPDCYKSWRKMLSHFWSYTQCCSVPYCLHFLLLGSILGQFPPLDSGTKKCGYFKSGWDTVGFSSQPKSYFYKKKWL